MNRRFTARMHTPSVGVRRSMRWFRRALLAATAALAIVPAVSNASAYGVQFWGGFNATVFGQTIRVPAGALFHLIEGRGLYVSGDGATFDSAGSICDWSMRFSYGYHTQVYNTRVHWGCAHSGTSAIAPRRRVRRGTACAALWIEGWRRYVTEQCHFVY
jgi:hypothetical protein